jgi:hypothetical protein
MNSEGESTLADLPHCEPTSPQGALASLTVGELRPTQNAVGMDEVNEKAEKIASMSASKLADYLLQRPIPVVIGEEAGYYMIDHHHLARALWDAGKRETNVPIVVAENWGVLRGPHFWKAMARRDWAYPFDGMGSGPTKPTLIKPHVKDLENDLYRSLAWYVRERYGFIKDLSNPIYAEFKWASFFRSRVIFWDALLDWPESNPVKMTLQYILEQHADEYSDKTAYALYLAGSPDARGLPGFIGCQC